MVVVVVVVVLVVVVVVVVVVVHWLQLEIMKPPLAAQTSSMQTTFGSLQSALAQRLADSHDAPAAVIRQQCFVIIVSFGSPQQVTP